METAPNKDDCIRLLNQSTTQTSLNLGVEDNQLAVNDMLDYINRKEKNYITVNLKNK